MHGLEKSRRVRGGIEEYTGGFESHGNPCAPNLETLFQTFAQSARLNAAGAGPQIRSARNFADLVFYERRMKVPILSTLRADIDTYDWLQAVLADGSHFGFNDVKDPCLVTAPTPTVCSNPYLNLFWDAERPTLVGALEVRRAGRAGDSSTMRNI